MFYKEEFPTKKIAEIYDKLVKKERMFSDYEAITKKMLICEFEEMSSLTEKRFEISQEIDKLDSEILILCEGDSLLRSAVRNSCNRDEVPEEMCGIFDQSQKIFAIINRIRNDELEIIQRLEINKLKIKEKIKATKGTHQIVNYLNAAGARPASGVLLGSKFRKV